MVLGQGLINNLCHLKMYRLKLRLELLHEAIQIDYINNHLNLNDFFAL